MFFDDWKIDFNIKCLKSITIFWCYVLWIRCWFEYYVKKSKTLKVDFKRLKRFNQNSFDFESINNETFFRRFNQNMFFVVFVRILDRKDTISHKTHLEQKTRINSILSKIESIYKTVEKNIRVIQSDEFWIERTCNLLDVYAINLTNMR